MNKNLQALNNKYSKTSTMNHVDQTSQIAQRFLINNPSVTESDLSKNNLLHSSIKEAALKILRKR